MTMYQGFLEIAVDELEREHRALEGPELEAALLHELADRRHVLGALAHGADPSTAIAAQVSYDAALVLLCRARGVTVDAAAFASPAAARRSLEAALTDDDDGADALAERPAV